MRYVSIHTHCTYSYGDGYGLPEDHMARIAELGMSAAALTDHGNVSGHVKWEIAGAKHGVKPLFGMEAYTAPADMVDKKNMRKWHMTMIAENATGYHNLMEMVTRSWNLDFYRWPTVLGESLAEHAEGIICTSGCSDGLLACTLFGGKGIAPPTTINERNRAWADARRIARSFKRLLGDGFYLEVQRFPELERTHSINQAYAALGAELKIPLVASSDVHYPKPEHNELQKILHAASRNTGTVAAAEAEWEYDILLTYPESDARVASDLVATGLSKRDAEAAIDATAEIAARATVTLPKMDRIRYPGTKKDLEPWTIPA